MSNMTTRTDLAAADRLTKNVRLLMLAADREPADLAEALGLTTQTVYKRLRGDRGWTLDELVALARYFGCSSDDLLRSTSDLLSVAVNIGRGSPAAAAGRTGMVRAA